MRILFADDSMTAQNMGKKILTEAGYDVVAVSNGAAAVKKIAEQKPDIIILDIYMPGYTGLEVCDKVRASVETLKTPVLLTVGKMEPYRAEDANRVKADGVIIKPFEASDLLAVIKRLEERVSPKSSAPITEQTILLERPPQFAEFPEPVTEDHAENVHVRESTVQATVDVPDNMASAAAFGDFLGPDPTETPVPAAAQPAQSSTVEFDIEPETAIETAPAASRAQDEEVAFGDDEVVAQEIASEAPTKAPEPTASPSWDPDASASYSTSDFGFDLQAAKESFLESAGSKDDRDEGLVSFPESAAIKPDPLLVQDHVAEKAELPSSGPATVHEVDPELVPSGSDASFAPIEETPAATIPQHQLEVVEMPTAEAESFSEPEPSAVFAAATLPVPEAAATEAPVKEEDAEPGEPATAHHPVEIDSFSAQVEAQIQHIETIVSASEARYTEPEVRTTSEIASATPAVTKEPVPVEEEPTHAPEDDFEARVAAAMSMYEAPSESHAPSLDAIEEPHATVSEYRGAPEPSSLPAPVEPAYSFEYSPPVTSAVAEPAVETSVPAAWHEPIEEIVPAPVEAVYSAEPPVATHEVQAKSAPSYEETVSTPPILVPVQSQETRAQSERIIHEIEAQIPAAALAESASTGSDNEVIASVVHRVLERLKPHLIDEISRELSSQKTPEEKK